MSERAWLVLGSNTGPSARTLRGALRALGRLPRTRWLAASRLFATSPVGRKRQPPFLNCAALLETSLSPMGLLVEAKRLEALAGRRPGPRWGPRPLDIDIIFYGRRRLRGRFLTIPHPRALERRFVLACLADLAPGLRPPGAVRRLARLRAPSQNVKIVSGPLLRRDHG